MASHVVVIATDLRRTTIKVNPGTYLADVLQEACKKLNLSSDRYLIKHRQKQIDLSVPFRTSGLIPGAKLELVQKSNTPSAIQVALQVPPPEGREIPGGRLIQKFPSDLTLWKVLRQFESGQASHGKNVNITARGVAQTSCSSGSGGGQLYYEIPVLNIMGRELASFADFQRTLSQLGYNSGSVLIRLAYRKTDQTLFDAMAEIGQFFNEEEAAPAAPEPAKKEAEEPTGETQDTPMEEAQSNSIEESSHDQQSAEQDGILAPSTDQAAKEDDMALDSSRPSNSLEPVGVFLAPSGTVPAAALVAVEEADYTPSIAHAQIHQARLQQSSRNTRLLSDKELEDKAAIENARLAAIKSVLIKVRFPDNTSSDWQVSPAETGRFLYDAVRHVMANDEQPFHLVLPGTTAVIKNADSPSDSLIKGYKLSGRVLVNLVWDDGVPAAVRKQPFLKSNVARQGQQVKVPEPLVVSDDKGKGPELPTLQPSDKGEGSGDKLGKKIPKWLKLGKK
ncbi:GLUT4 regulating protein TUG-domain-containing protein [Dactylonectria macrodidyma]|uniref:GLUT4 regulating protein TUG-domain-containing protein n=1 Tax=Dactylonectria macrodidyma TaxID=307937 RepID=A0A9P9E9H0_9HYPO|nr:GLUT4 regulating protein TUG-domain-containing protein [Dactylonectria macrodidyma]